MAVGGEPQFQIQRRLAKTIAPELRVWSSPCRTLKKARLLVSSRTDSSGLVRTLVRTDG